MIKIRRWQSVFGVLKPVIIGMIHVNALPGTPKHVLTMHEIVERSIKEAEIYKRANLDAVLIENMHDIPYNSNLEIGPEIISGMSRICTEVKKILGKIPCGVQILAAGNQAAMAVAHTTGLQFIRVESFVFSHVADEGILNACAGPLLRYRKYIGAENILVLTDIKKKHASHAITADMSITETAKAAEFFSSDGVIITGKSTGDPANKDEILNIQKVVTIPTIVGSGVTLNNLHNYKDCDGLIVGSYFKTKHQWENELEEDQVRKFMDCLHNLRTHKI